MIDWTHWHNEPFLTGGLIFLGWFYALLIGPWRGQIAPGEPYPRSHAIKFYAALVCFYLAVGSPLDQYADRFLLSAHMAQHQIIMYPTAVLFLLGLPGWAVRPVMTWPPLRALFRILTYPLVCAGLYVSVITIWHLPFLYDWALQNRPIHIVEHFMMFGVSLLYWWPLLSPSKEFPRLPYAAQMLYLVAVIIGLTPLFAYITFSTDILYPTYEFAPRVTDLSAAGDQLLAGCMMELIGMAVSMVAFASSFYRWYQSGEVTRAKQ